MNKPVTFTHLPRLLAILLSTATVFLANSVAADLRITYPSNVIFEVSGGSGDKTWHVQYGGVRAPYYQVKTLSGPGSTAYFTHGGWLRRVDADKGLVTGR